MTCHILIYHTSQLSHTDLSHITTVTYWSITHHNCHILIYHTSQLSHTDLSHITTVTYWSITHHNCHILIYHTSQLSHTDLSHITTVTYWSITHHNCHILIYPTSQLSWHCWDISSIYLYTLYVGSCVESILLYCSTGSQSWYITLQGVNLDILLYRESILLYSFILSLYILPMLLTFWL
jgi:hypothetical protein